MLGAIGGFIRDNVGSLLGFGSQERTNRINQREAAKNRAFQADQAGRQMQFQERMRNTAWQSAVADMEAAGINPAVAYSQGGAQVPGGASGGGSQAAPAGDSASSAFQVAQQQKALKLMNAQIDKAKGEARSAQAEGSLASQRANWWLRTFSANGRRSSPMLNDLLQAELDSARAGATNMAALSERNRQLARIARPMGDLSESMGTMLPILTGLVGAAGPAGNFIRSMSRRRRR